MLRALNSNQTEPLRPLLHFLIQHDRVCAHVCFNLDIFDLLDLSEPLPPLLDLLLQFEFLQTIGRCLSETLRPPPQSLQVSARSLADLAVA